MSWTQHNWPQDLDPQNSAYPEWMVRLANRSRFRTRFWLSPVGVVILVILLGGAWVLQQIFNS